MYNNGKKPQKPGKTPSNYNQHQQIQAKLDSAFDNLDIFDKTDNVVTFKTDNPPSYPVEDCDNNTTIPYDDQPFLQSSPIHQNNSNHFLSSWTGYPTAPNNITPLRPSIIRRPTIPSFFNTRKRLNIFLHYILLCRHRHHLQFPVHTKLDSSFEGLDIFADQQEDVISFKKGYPIENPVADCDNDTTIPYVDDQSVVANPFDSSWTGQSTLRYDHLLYTGH
ncbi:unnamed protein product [Mytilus edulis]|uniref:Uncharacterized protein n=1 Tax=Mytilus edulis TaxID=6550 RepID=A0A8S3SGH7_MYTED|nr:unnamed protein product [Mytilus edulis]